MDVRKSEEPGAGTGSERDVVDVADPESRPVPWAQEEYLDPIQDAIRGLAKQPTFSGEREIGKWPAGARFLHRCLVVLFVGSLFPLGIAMMDAIQEMHGNGGVARPWLKVATLLLTLTTAGLALWTRRKSPSAH